MVAAVILFVAAVLIFTHFMPKNGRLVLSDGDTGTIYGEFNVEEGSMFSITFIHSVNKSPIEEIYQIKDDGIYLEEYNQSVAESDRLVSVCSVHVEPLGIYKGGKATGTTLQEILEKDSLVISLTNDATNQSRALRLLESLGVITVTNDKEIITVEDCDWQGHQYREINASLLGSSLADVDLAVIPGNYALLAGLKEALATEDSSVTSQYANIIAVRPENLDSDIAKALKEVLTGEEVAQFIADKYGDAVQVVK